MVFGGGYLGSGGGWLLVIVRRALFDFPINPLLYQPPTPLIRHQILPKKTAHPHLAVHLPQGVDVGAVCSVHDKLGITRLV